MFTEFSLCALFLHVLNTHFGIYYKHYNYCKINFNLKIILTLCFFSPD